MQCMPSLINTHDRANPSPHPLPLWNSVSLSFTHGYWPFPSLRNETSKLGHLGIGLSFFFKKATLKPMAPR